MTSDQKTRLSRLCATVCTTLGLALNVAQASTGTIDDPYRVAMVLWRGETEVEAGFRAYMDAQGVHVDAKIYDTQRDRSKIPGFISEIRQERPDLVYTWGTSVTSAVAGTYDEFDPAQNITDIPIIFTMVADPIGARIVRDLGATGRNVTGTSFLAPLEAQLRTIEEYFGAMPTIGVIYNPKERNSSLNADALRSLAQSKRFPLHVRSVPLTREGKPDPSTIYELVRDITNAGAEVLYIGPDSFLAVHGEALTGAAIEHGIPTFAATEQPLRKAQAMMGLVSNYYTLGQFVAFKALKLLRHEIEAEDSPIETLSRFSFMLNMPVALRSGHYPPISMLKYTVLIEKDTIPITNDPAAAASRPSSDFQSGPPGR